MNLPGLQSDSIDFSRVAGLDERMRLGYRGCLITYCVLADIAALKEMVAIPLMYPELFANFQISPPRGVLFHGPPGTGKTLMGTYIDRFI